MRSVIAFCLLAVLFAGCGRHESTADQKQREATDKLTAEAQRQVGMPNIVNFQERKLMKMILELRDKEDLICYAYIVAKYSGKLIYLGRCVGFGLPYSVQFTNPEAAHWSVGSRLWTLPQPDPNGLFMPEGLSATWLMLMDPKTNEARPVYVEPEIIVSPFPLHQE